MADKDLNALFLDTLSAYRYVMSRPETGKTAAFAILIAAGWHLACNSQRRRFNSVAIRPGRR